MSDYEIERRGGGRGVVWVAVTIAVVALGLIGWALVGGRGSGTAPGGALRAGGIRIVASIPPLAWPARELVPEAELTVLAGPGASAHGMELTPGHVRALAEADLVLLVGLGLDDSVRRVLDSNPREGRELVVMGELLEVAGVMAPVLEDDHDHGDGEGHDHAHGVVDPHAWLDPLVMRAFVGRVSAALERARGGVAMGGTLLQERCESIDQMYRLALTPLERRTIVCQHHAYGYLASRYRLEVAAVIQPIEGGEVRPGDVRAVVDAIRAHGVGAIFVEPQVPARAAERIAVETGVKVLTLDPLGDGDWARLMSENLEALVEGLSEVGTANGAMSE